MPIITERFLATYDGPYRIKAASPAREIIWEWQYRAAPSKCYQLIYHSKKREFSGIAFGGSQSRPISRRLTPKSAEKLRKMLPASEIAAALRYSVTGEFPQW